MVLFKVSGSFYNKNGTFLQLSVMRAFTSHLGARVPGAAEKSFLLLHIFLSGNRNAGGSRKADTVTEEGRWRCLALREITVRVSVCVGGGVERETCLESRFCFRYLLNYSLGCHGNQQNVLNKSTQK